MDEEKKLVKDDINFLEYPDWVLDRKSKITRWMLEKKHGCYEIECSRGLPTHFDKIVLYYLLYRLYNESGFNQLELLTTRYEIAKQVFPCNKKPGKQQFDRVLESLKKWKSIAIHFNGVFYEGDGHTIRGFSILDEYVLRTESKQLTLRFNASYIKQLQETKFYKLIDFEEYKKLTRSVSARLYEILIKNFKERDCWSISINTLAEKLTLEKRKGAKSYYPSDVLIQLKPGINEINKKTEISIGFSYDKNTCICAFKKLENKPAFKPAIEERPKKTAAVAEAEVISRTEVFNATQESCLAYFETFSDEEKAAILQEIERDPFAKYIPDKAARIYAFLTKHNMWQPQAEQKALEKEQSN